MLWYSWWSSSPLDGGSPKIYQGTLFRSPHVKHVFSICEFRFSTNQFPIRQQLLRYWSDLLPEPGAAGGHLPLPGLWDICSHPLLGSLNLLLLSLDHVSTTAFPGHVATWILCFLQAGRGEPGASGLFNCPSSAHPASASLCVWSIHMPPRVFPRWHLGKWTASPSVFGFPHTDLDGFKRRGKKSVFLTCSSHLTRKGLSLYSLLSLCYNPLCP